MIDVVILIKVLCVLFFNFVFCFGIVFCKQLNVANYGQLSIQFVAKFVVASLYNILMLLVCILFFNNVKVVFFCICSVVLNVFMGVKKICYVAFSTFANFVITFIGICGQYVFNVVIILVFVVVFLNWFNGVCMIVNDIFLYNFGILFFLYSVLMFDSIVSSFAY